MVGVPFERPAESAGRTEVTNEEFAAREERAKRQAQSDGEEFVSTAPRTGDGTGPPSHWLEWGKPSRQASLVVAPGDGKLPPMTPEGQQRSAASKNTYVMFSGFRDATDMGPYDRCISRGVLGSTFPVIYNNGNLSMTSDALELVERFTRTGPDTIQYEVTATDPKTWTRPWTVAFPLRRDPNYRIFEYACHEGNHAMANILSASRAEERQAK